MPSAEVDGGGDAWDVAACRSSQDNKHDEDKAEVGSTLDGRSMDLVSITSSCVGTHPVIKAKGRSLSSLPGSPYLIMRTSSSRYVSWYSGPSDLC